jgi:hypothetical protein
MKAPKSKKRGVEIAGVLTLLIRRERKTAARGSRRSDEKRPTWWVKKMKRGICSSDLKVEEEAANRRKTNGMEEYEVYEDDGDGK